ncbi:MAG: hypothetical protein Q9M28_06285 [Mariprofundaceae bacterium]|nr:hypothetical protein [Mariprofundaceae bacterium]
MKSETVIPVAIQEMVNNTEKMHQMIGQHIRYLNKAYKIIDVVMDDGVMVAVDLHATSMQNDVYGRATRVVPDEKTFLFRDHSGSPSHIWDDITFL